MTIRGRGTRRGHGRGHPQPSESCTSPLLAHVENEEIQLMMKRPPKSHLNQVFKYLEMTTRGRGGLSRGSSDPLQPYRLRTSPTQPLHVSTSRGDKEQFVGDYSEGEHEEMQLIRDKFGQIGSNQHIKMAIRRKRSTRTRGRGCRGPPQPSQSCTSPTPPQKSLSPGINNEFYDYDDGDELQLIRERTNQQKLLKKQALYHEPKNLGALSGYSASKSRIGAPSSGIRIRVKGSTMNFNNENVNGAASDSIPHSTDQPAKVPEVWVEVSGPKKKRPFGSRSLEIGTTSSSQNIGPSHTIAPIQEDIKEAVNMAMASFVRSHLVPLLEPILLRLETMHDDD